MSIHVFGAVLTSSGVASNNRGEEDGHVATLQKILRHGDVYTTVSAEALRYALREHWGARGEALNRRVGEHGSTWTDTSFATWREHLDDDVLGFMDPAQASHKRRGRLELSRALSTRPWAGETLFQVASVGAHPRVNPTPVPYAVEVHATRYQYLFALTPEELDDPSRALKALDAILHLRRVAGNHGRFLFDFSPAAILCRITADPVPRMMYCFDEDEHGDIGLDSVVYAIEAGDIDGRELVAGGQPLARLRDALSAVGVTVYPGVKAAFDDVRGRLGAP